MDDGDKYHTLILRCERAKRESLEGWATIKNPYPSVLTIFSTLILRCFCEAKASKDEETTPLHRKLLRIAEMETAVERGVIPGTVIPDLIRDPGLVQNYSL